MSLKLNSEIAVVGIDIGKNCFHIVGLDRRGAIVLRQKHTMASPARGHGDGSDAILESEHARRLRVLDLEPVLRAGRPENESTVNCESARVGQGKPHHVLSGAGGQGERGHQGCGGHGAAGGASGGAAIGALTGAAAGAGTAFRGGLRGVSAGGTQPFLSRRRMVERATCWAN
jgi:hypothetical protein